MTIHYEIHGQGQPLLMLHGWAMHSHIWHDFALQLAQHFQVILVDLPGHGYSAAADAFELDCILAAILPVLPQQPVTLLGWSLGATVALALAQSVPVRIKQVIVLAGNPCFVQTHDWPGMAVQTLDVFADLLKRDVQQTLIRFLALQVNGLTQGKALLQQLKQAINERPAPSQSVLQAGLQLLKTTDLRKVLVNQPVPINVILGGKDTLVPVACGQAMQALNPQLSVQVLAAAGHAPFLSHPDELILAIQRMLL